MLPEERACYIDLLIYQHQNGIIPKDTKRVMMFCSGIDEATLEAVLKAKFVLTDEGYINHKLDTVVKERVEYKNKKSESGRIGQFYKKCKSLLTNAQYSKIQSLKEYFSREEILNLLEKYNNDALSVAKAMLKHIEDEDEIEIKDINKGNGILNRKNIQLVQRQIDWLKENHSYDASEEIGYLTSLNNRLKKKREDTGRPTEDDDIFQAFCFFIDHIPDWFNYFSMKAFDNNFESLQKAIKDKIEEESKEFHPTIERI